MIAAVIWGLISYFVFRRFAPHAQLRVVRRRIHAGLLGIRLYSEDPAAVWRAQKSVIAANLRGLALLAKPVLILAIPFAFLYSPLDSLYGWLPLELNHSATVTLQLPDNADTEYTLFPPPGIVVETPPVHIAALHQIVWRIRPIAPVRGLLRFDRAGREIVRPINAGPGRIARNRRRVMTPETPWIEIDYPPAPGHWLLRFFLIAAAVAAATHLILHRSHRTFVNAK
ncbi:MAG TPA: hypothetical protein VHC90_02310 [Bryobacteraceae bacterium]|nr:hypothetical protein [Bryobacteraceae bacterium]